MRPGERAREAAFHLLDALSGSRIRHAIDVLDRAQRMDPDALRRWQAERLHRLLGCARDGTRFYRRLIPRDFSERESFDVLSSLPVVAKARIVADPEAFLSSTVPRRGLVSGTTSGSTGRAFTYWMDRGRRIRIRAEILYFAGWAGYRAGMRHLVLALVPSRPRSVARQIVMNQRLADTTAIDGGRLEEIRRRILRERPRILFGYPWVLRLLAEHCLARGSPRVGASLRGVVTFAEALPELSRRLIESAFGCEVFERYSALEVGVIASECEAHRMHLNTGSLFAESVGLEPGTATADGPARLVLTDLFNRGMPLLRYDIEDDIALDRTRCPCGRTSPVLAAIHGRTVDQITSPDGRWIDPVAIGRIVERIPGVEHYQFVQQDEAAYLVRIVLGEQCERGITETIVSRYQVLLGGSAHVDVARVKEIPMLPSGKRPCVLSEFRRGKTV